MASFEEPVMIERIDLLPDSTEPLAIVKTAEETGDEPRLELTGFPVVLVLPVLSEDSTALVDDLEGAVEAVGGLGFEPLDAVEVVKNSVELVPEFEADEIGVKNAGV